ncbi:putative 3-mercaptopyruvate sulfurtransferase, partial [Vibrio parahaemolyticus V-223/04]
KRGCPS